MTWRKAESHAIEGLRYLCIFRAFSAVRERGSVGSLPC
jgi:hypothetical protein